MNSIYFYIALFIFCRNNLVGVARIDAPAQPSTGLVRRVRLPDIGLFDHYLNCIMVRFIVFKVIILSMTVPGVYEKF